MSKKAETAVPPSDTPPEATVVEPLVPGAEVSPAPLVPGAPPVAEPKFWYRVSLSGPGPYAKNPCDVEAGSEDEAKRLFNEANGITYSMHPYSIRKVEPGTPLDAPPASAGDLKTYALALATEFDNMAREFGPDRTRRVAINDDKAREICAKLRELAKK
jgi:hypothetical protein